MDTPKQQKKVKEQFYTKLRLSKFNKQRLTEINNILEEYVADGYTLTLRQLYYQLVSRDIIPNSQKEYIKLMHILKKGRMSGIVDWDSIEDRVRVPKLPYWVHDIPDAIEDTVRTYRLHRMKGQSTNVEVWIEKDALSSVFYRVTSKYGVRLMVNRGYSSVSAMYQAHRRLKDGDCILYFGDHDPSGLDMVRDVKERLDEFRVDVDVIPIALTRKQINKFNPPPNPAKISDPRAQWYIEKYGDTSWELDALPPSELINLTEDAILSKIDLDQYNKVVNQERADIIELKKKFDL